MTRQAVWDDPRLAPRSHDEFVDSVGAAKGMTMSTQIHRRRSGLITAALVTALILAGCTTTPDDADSDATSGEAARFVACLTAAGVEAKISDQGYVVVKTGSAAPDGSVSTTSENTGPGMLMMMSDSEGSWVAAESSAYFETDTDTQDAYAACEQDVPDFVQPEVDPLDDPQMQEYLAQQAEDGLTFARCAREAGFAWVADPTGEAGTTAAIALPADLTEDEFRALLEACFEPELALAWMIESELGFDWNTVLEEYADGVSGSSVVVGGGDEE
jgi:hypothetical protein